MKFEIVFILNCINLIYTLNCVQDEYNEATKKLTTIITNTSLGIVDKEDGISLVSQAVKLCANSYVIKRASYSDDNYYILSPGNRYGITESVLDYDQINDILKLLTKHDFHFNEHNSDSITNNVYDIKVICLIDKYHINNHNKEYVFICYCNKDICNKHKKFKDIIKYIEYL